MTDNDKAMGAFLAARADSLETLEHIKSMVEAYYEVSPDDVNWSWAETARNYALKLKVISDQMYRKGEYADVQATE